MLCYIASLSTDISFDMSKTKYNIYAVMIRIKIQFHTIHARWRERCPLPSPHRLFQHIQFKENLFPGHSNNQVCGQGNQNYQPFRKPSSCLTWSKKICMHFHINHYLKAIFKGIILQQKSAELTPPYEKNLCCKFNV